MILYQFQWMDFSFSPNPPDENATKSSDDPKIPKFSTVR